MIPGELAALLNELGYTWPMSDETKMMELGQAWFEMTAPLDAAVAGSESAVSAMVQHNRSGDVQAFLNRWGGDDEALAVLRDAAVGSQAVGATLIVCAMIVLALKINVIVQLTILLIQIIQAIATAAVTFGASLLEIPIFKKLTDLVIDLLIDQAIGVVLG
ncbi:WXG100-like domain-containing protein [Catenuloplanes japonicus]|uniref:WXG100-like domain-containing protein n=1 Tax=Catenuloplanes japonicus TaxID=33876 RepID=UPI001E446137|nr:hypothetical protein [Catenuloplanes japonicus]